MSNLLLAKGPSPLTIGMLQSCSCLMCSTVSGFRDTDYISNTLKVLETLISKWSFAFIFWTSFWSRYPSDPKGFKIKIKLKSIYSFCRYCPRGCPPFYGILLTTWRWPKEAIWDPIYAPVSKQKLLNASKFCKIRKKSTIKVEMLRYVLCKMWL